MLERVARSAVRRFGLEDQARVCVQLTSPIGRRDLRDDRQMAAFMAKLPRDANCIDIGANRGRVLRKMLSVAPAGHHMAFEPIPDLAARLAGEFPNVEVHAAALSDENSETTFYLADRPALSGLRRREWVNTGYTEIEVEVRRLDDVAPLSRSVSFLKLDVEGAEVCVLRGAQRLLAEHHPAIWFEHGARSPSVYDTTTADLWALLTDHGYRVWTADGHGPLSCEEMQAAHALPTWTFLAHA
jgi:FkbM family methyltransferase